MRIGYARVSRKDQRLESQRDALLADGCELVFEEKVSSREAERGVLREALDYCREGDVLVVTRLDWLGRSLKELIDLVGELESARARGRHGGRPRALDENQAKLARRLKGEGKHSVEEICSMLRIGRSTLYRYLGENNEGGAEKRDDGSSPDLLRIP